MFHNNDPIEKITNLFHKKVVEFVDELMTLYPDIVAKMTLARVYINDQITPRKLIDKFVQRFLPHKKLIEDRNHKFFDDESYFTELFEEAGIHCDFKMKYVWDQKTLPEDRQMIWEWLDAFIKILTKFQETRKMKRE